MVLQKKVIQLYEEMPQKKFIKKKKSHILLVFKKSYLYFYIILLKFEYQHVCILIIKHNR